MTAPESPAASPAGVPKRERPASRLSALVAAGLLVWLLIAGGFLGLRVLMQERPQFVGPATRSAMITLVQDSPQAVFRRVGDDVAAVRALRPEFSEVIFDLQGRHDHRGLKTVVEMGGTVVARHVLTNALAEPIFVLFRCPHPRAGDPAGPLQASGLRLRSSVPGLEESVRDAWLWSGEVAPHAAATVEVSYQAAALKGIRYQVNGPGGEAVKRLKVELRRTGLESLRVEAGEGALVEAGGPILWERGNFLGPDGFAAAISEVRNLHDSLLQLLEIGPLVCLLFLVAVAAAVGSCRPLTVAQVLTLSVGHALYFPLVVYLSARFSFAVALVLSAVVPGGLLLNYARVQWGNRAGLGGGAFVLGLYQVFPTLAAFAGWNRGLVLLCLGLVTFAVLIQLQNRALRPVAAALAVLGGCLFPEPVRAGEVQVLLPAQLVPGWPNTNLAPSAPLLSFAPANYRAVQHGEQFEVTASAPFTVLRPGDAPVPLFVLAVYLRSQVMDADSAEVAAFATVSNRPALLALKAGSGTLRLTYRVPVETRDGRKRVGIPLLSATAGEVRVESARPDLLPLTGSLWSRQSSEGKTIHEFGVVGEDRLALEWRDGEETGPGNLPPESRSMYGIGITLAQHLTVIGSDGSATQFSEFDLPATADREFRLRLPPRTKLVSVSVNGAEVAAPPVDGSLCQLRLPEMPPQRTGYRVSFRFAGEPVRLGFVGVCELALPETLLTAGSVRWTVALPAGFSTQVLASGLETQKSPPDLARFGDYGRLVNPGASLHLTKELAPPGPVTLSLRYRQAVTGWDAP